MALKGKKSLAETLIKSRDIQGFLDELEAESDRGSAIIGASFLDEQLRQLLVNFLVDDEKEVGLFIFGESPLGAFGARVRAAYCMGLIPREYFEALKLIKDIRNAFAHQLHGRSFNDIDIVEDCRKLHALMPLQPRGIHTPRQMFESATVFLMMDIGIKVLSVLQKRCKTPSTPAVTKFISV